MKFLREYVYPVLVGGIPMLIGVLAVKPMVLYWIVAKAIPVLMPIPSLFFLYAWARLGYRCRVNGWGAKAVILAQVIPVAAVVASLYQNILPVEAQNDLLLSLGFVATFPAENLALTLTFFYFDLAVAMILSLLLMIGAFVSGFVAAGINMRKAVGSGANETE